MMPFVIVLFLRRRAVREIDLVAARRAVEFVRLAQRAVALVEADDVELAVGLVLGAQRELMPDDGQVVESL